MGHIGSGFLVSGYRSPFLLGYHVFLGDGHLVCFCLLALVNTHKSIDIPSSPLEIDPEWERYMVNLFLIFEGVFRLSPIIAMSFFFLRERQLS